MLDAFRCLEDIRQKYVADSSQAKETQRGICGFRQPGDLVAKSTQLKTHGFASPVFTGFAFVVCYGAILARDFAIVPYHQF
jgi:hypothetical protein